MGGEGIGGRIGGGARRDFKGKSLLYVVLVTISYGGSAQVRTEERNEPCIKMELPCFLHGWQQCVVQRAH